MIAVGLMVGLICPEIIGESCLISILGIGITVAGLLLTWKAEQLR